MFHPIGNSYTDIVTTLNPPLNNVSRHQKGLIVIHPIVEEPDDGKLSRPVLQTIVGGDPGDEFNLKHSDEFNPKVGSSWFIFLI